MGFLCKSQHASFLCSSLQQCLHQGWPCCWFWPNPFIVPLRTSGTLFSSPIYFPKDLATTVFPTLGPLNVGLNYSPLSGPFLFILQSHQSTMKWEKPKDGDDYITQLTPIAYYRNGQSNFRLHCNRTPLLSCRRWWSAPTKMSTKISRPKIPNAKHHPEIDMMQEDEALTTKPN